MISLLAPSLAIAAAAATLIPLAIHLLWRRRRRPIEWGAMALLLEAVRRRRRALQLERWILLATRMLLLLLLGLGLAQLSLAGGGLSGGGRTVHLVLDEGVASAAIESDGRTTLEAIADEAAAIVAGLGASDEASVITASSPPRILVEPTADHGRALAAIREAKASASPSDLEGAIALVDSLRRSREEPAAIVLLSGFRGGAVATLPRQARGGGLPPEEAPILRLATTPRTEPVANAAVAAIEAGRPIAGGGVAPLRVTIRREGPLEAATVDLRIGGPDLPTSITRSVRFSAGQRERSVEVGVPIGTLGSPSEPEAPRLVEASVGPDAQAFDDRGLAMLDTRRRVRIGLASRGGRFGEDAGGGWLVRALAPDRSSPDEVVEIDAAALGGGDLQGLDAVVVARPDLLDAAAWPRLRAFADGGGLVVVLPPAGEAIHGWLDPLAAAFDPPWRFAAAAESLDPPQAVVPPPGGSSWISAISAEAAELAEAVEVFRRLPPQGGVEAASRILDLEDGTPLVVVSESRGGSGGALVLATAAADLSWTTLPVRPLMVPLLQEILREGVARRARGRAAWVGEAAPAAAAMAESIRTPSGEVVAVREGRLARPLAEPGVHAVLDRAGRPRDRFVARVDPLAASTRVLGEGEVRERLGEGWSFGNGEAIAGRLAGEESGRSLAAALLAAAVALAVLETILANRFSHPSPLGRSEDRGIAGAAA